MQEQIEESRDLVAQQERQLAWREMARQVAHEIKNPLTPMRLSIQHLRSAFERLENDTDRVGFIDKFNRTTSTLLEQIDTLTRIANEFSSFGRMPTHIREELDLNAVVREAASLMQAEEGVELRLKVDERPLAALGDREALRRVLVNFIKNALQAVPDDRSAIVTILTGPAQLAGGQPAAECRVEDNGTGIPEQLADKVFEPSFSTKTSGTGLGLAIAERMARLLGHELVLESHPGRGTLFAVCVPLAESTAQRPATDPAATPAAGARVLLVDNDRRMLASLAAMLGDWGLDVTAVPDAGQALADATGTEFDLLMLDYHLDAGQTGLDLLGRLRAVGHAAPALLISADHAADLKRAAHAAGCELLHKPIRPLALRSMLRRVLG